MTFAPMLDVGALPRVGASAWKGPGEDPCSAHALPSAKVRGFQGAGLMRRADALAAVCQALLQPTGPVTRRTGLRLGPTFYRANLARSVHDPPFAAVRLPRAWRPSCPRSWILAGIPQ